MNDVKQDILDFLVSAIYYAKSSTWQGFDFARATS